MLDENLSIEEVKKIRRERYNRTRSMPCPLLKEEVFFNKDGFYHATHDGRGKLRNKSDATMRLHLLPWIYRVIKKSRTHASPPRIIPISDPENKTGKEIVFYELSYKFKLAKNKTVSVILRKIGNGQLHYFSVRYTKTK